MEQIHIIYLFYIVKHFTPFVSFLVPYLIEVKKFRNIEIYNDLNIYFFLSSLTVSLFVFVLVNFIGNFNLLIVDMLLEISAYLLLRTMSERAFCTAKIVSTLHGTSTALGSVLRSIIISSTHKDKHKNADVMSTVSIIRSVTSVFSSWIGQDLFIRTRQHNVNLYLTGMSLCCALIVSCCFDDNGSTGSRQSTIAVDTNMFKDSRIIFFGLLHITANILTICVAFFSSNIFVERKKIGNGKLARFLFNVLQPFRLISSGIIKTYKIFGGSLDTCKDEKDDINRTKELVVHGYIDGIAKISASLVCYFVTKFPVQDNDRVFVTLILVFITIANLYGLYKIDSLEMSYLFYIIAFSMSIATKTVVFVEFANHSSKNFIFSLLIFLSSLVHIALSFVALKRKADVRKRFKYYLYVSGLLIGSAIGIMFLAS